MASLKEMRNRIGSVKATQKITKAMQMVAAAKLKRAQDQAESARPYAQKMASVIANLAAGVSGADAPRLLAGTGADQRHLIVVATADKGLAGGFNTNVIRAARERINSLIAAGKDVRIIAVGRKSRDGLSRLYGDKLVKTFEKLGISLNEQKRLTGVAVDAVIDCNCSLCRRRGHAAVLPCCCCRPLHNMLRIHPKYFVFKILTIIPFDMFIETLVHTTESRSGTPSVICNFSHSYSFGPKATNFSNDTSTGAKIIDHHHNIIVYK